MEPYDEVLQKALSSEDYRRLAAVPVKRVREFVADAVVLCRPERVMVFDDSAEGMEETRRMALESGEERPLAIPRHSVHFDGPTDQGRDRKATRYLVPEGEPFPAALNQLPRSQGLPEVRELLRGAMQGKTMIVRFLSLGPAESVFSVPCIEVTDSWYVSHSLNLLYRPAYEVFRRLAADAEVFMVLHSAGRLDERNVSAQPDKRRIYIDYSENTVYSVNTQYAGNTVGLKKLALRLAIRKADREGWLAEHMFISGIFGPGGRKTYFAGAFPSACGKTSTAMLPGETILGDDLAYFRSVDGEFRAVNIESGIFGIIQNVSRESDPLIWEVLTRPGAEVIFSNVLVKDGRPYWLGMGEAIPEEGENFTGPWRRGSRDAAGDEIPPAHKNARYTVPLSSLRNCDPALDDPRGVVLRAILYGGRDPEAYVPCQEAFDWEHGIVTFGVALETRTTFATVGKEGVPEINIMSIQDFVSIPLGKYVKNNLDFGRRVKRPPLVFGVNYFLCGRNGEYLNQVQDKHVWIKWME
ncbi:MAG TPA: phosphoenolpyruvate carboxykinase (GTP), partial [Kiritimatiellae bacterium]|nr:phosphoenolpyruvate carboxykinase (GTP) [Kiritimatiellia bacterium]